MNEIRVLLMLNLQNNKRPLLHERKQRSFIFHFFREDNQGRH